MKNVVLAVALLVSSTSLWAAHPVTVERGYVVTETGGDSVYFCSIKGVSHGQPALKRGEILLSCVEMTQQAAESLKQVCLGGGEVGAGTIVCGNDLEAERDLKESF